MKPPRSVNPLKSRTVEALHAVANDARTTSYGGPAAPVVNPSLSIADPEVSRLSVAAALSVGALLDAFDAARGRSSRASPKMPQDFSAQLVAAAHHILQRGVALEREGREGAETALGAASSALDLLGWIEGLVPAEDDEAAPSSTTPRVPPPPVL